MPKHERAKRVLQAATDQLFMQRKRS